MKREREIMSTFSLSKKAKASTFPLAWRENEDIVNVFGKPDEQPKYQREVSRARGATRGEPGLLQLSQAMRGKP